MTRKRNRYAPARIAQSKLTEVTHDNRNVIDQTTVNYMEDLHEGSKALCAAIMRSGKWHRPMSIAEELDAIEYAHGVKLEVTGR